MDITKPNFIFMDFSDFNLKLIFFDLTFYIQRSIFSKRVSTEDFTLTIKNLSFLSSHLIINHGQRHYLKFQGHS